MSFVEIGGDSTKSWHIPVLHQLIAKLMIFNSDFYRHTNTRNYGKNTLTEE